MKWTFAGIAAVCIALYVTAQVTQSRPSDGKVHIRWSTDDAPSRAQQTRRFAEQNPGYVADVDPGLGGDTVKLVVQCATGVGPDVVDVYSQELMVGHVEAGILLDLTPYAQKMGFGPDKTYPALRSGLLVDGRQYRYPCNVWANVVVFNKAIFDDHGVSYPDGSWSWDEFIEVGKKFLVPGKSGKTHIPYSSYHQNMLFNDLLVSQGGHRYSPDGLVCELDSPEALKAWQLYGDLVSKYHIIPSPAEALAINNQGGWGLSGLHWFSNQQAAMIPIGRWYLVIARDYPDILPHLGAARLPHAAGRTSTGVIDARGSAINAKSPNREAALKWLAYLASPAYNEQIVADGDALPPNPELARRGEDLVNPLQKDPAWHQVFIDAARDARPLDNSPYFDPSVGERWMTEMLSKVDSVVVSSSPAERQPAEAARRSPRRLP